MPIGESLPILNLIPVIFKIFKVYIRDGGEQEIWFLVDLKILLWLK